MKVFCVLFLVLLNTIGNQGDPNHGLINFETDPEEYPLYIVSMRNYANCHICTGSIISGKWILSSLDCLGATHLLHGLREYENCTEIQEDSYRAITQTYIIPNLCLMNKVAMMFNTTVDYLFRPESNSSLPETGAVIGWSFDSNKTKFLMNKIEGINITTAFSNETNEAFFQDLCRVGTGSPLIFDGFIYGILSCSKYRFYNILADVDLIEKAIKRYP